MTTPIKLTDTQLILLSAAAQRDDGLLVQPARLKGGAATTVMEKLLTAAYVEEVAVGRDGPHWREDTEGRRIGLKITPAGLKAIGIGPEGEDSDDASVEEGAPALSEPEGGSAPASALSQPVRTGSKQALVLSLLRRDEGATLDDLVQATGWLPHTTRAALTGLRQRGYEIARSKGQDDKSVYRIERNANEAATVLPAPAEA